MDFWYFLDQWQAWFRSHTWSALLMMLLPFLLLDTPRYLLSNVYFLIVDSIRGFPVRGVRDYCPSVSVILAAYNEAEGIGMTIASLRGTYPRMEIIVVDDGSTDGMAEIVRPFEEAGDCRLFVRPERMGKPSAINFALQHVTGEIVVTVDSDSTVEPDTIWELVQPLGDPAVGVSAGTLRVRNRSRNLVTMLQAYDYLQLIFLGRRTAARIDALSVASGALSAFRRSMLDEVGGWDVHPADDVDITFKARKAGLKIAFAPFAVCHTDVPDTWRRMFHQRRRWSRAPVTMSIRKHADMGTIKRERFRLGNLLAALDAWVFEIGLMLLFWAWVIWIAFHWTQHLANIIVLMILAYSLVNFFQACIMLVYSDRRLDDLLTCTVLPFYYLPYRILLRCGRLIAIVEEFFWGASYDDPFIPQHVRERARRW